MSSTPKMHLREDEDILTVDHIPEYFKEVPLNALNHTTRTEISLYLDIRDDLRAHDWRGVAEAIGCRPIEIDNMANKTSPMQAVFTKAMQRQCTMYDFIEILLDLQRIDVITECKNFLVRDATIHKNRPVQDGEVTSTRQPYTRGELNTGEPEYFDAFVSHHPQDQEFVEVLIEKLEEEHGLKLCVIDRDMIIGVSQQEATAELIEKRCKRVILVLSSSYINGDERDNMLKWELAFANALAPAAQKINKLIPILIEPEVVPPSVLRPYNVSDYTKNAQRQWFWERVKDSLRAPTNGVGYEGPSNPRMAERQNRQEAEQNRNRSSSSPSSYASSIHSAPTSIEKSHSSTSFPSFTQHRSRNSSSPSLYAVNQPQSLASSSSDFPDTLESGPNSKFYRSLEASQLSSSSDSHRPKKRFPR